MSATRINPVTRVKGNSESSYRTGDVNITAANIGACPSSTVWDNGEATILQFINSSTNTTYRLNLTKEGRLMLGKRVGSGSWTLKDVSSI